MNKIKKREKKKKLEIINNKTKAHTSD